MGERFSVFNNGNGWRIEFAFHGAVRVLTLDEAEELKITLKSAIEKAQAFEALHGDGEKGEEPPAGLFHGPGLPPREINDKPTSSPTRIEWTLWAKDVAYRITAKWYLSNEEATIAIQNALLTMPIVPKE